MCNSDFISKNTYILSKYDSLLFLLAWNLYFLPTCWERSTVWEMDAHIVKANIIIDFRCCLCKSIRPSYPCPIHSGDSDLLAIVVGCASWNTSRAERSTCTPVLSPVIQDWFQCCTVLHDELRHFGHLLGSSLTLHFPHWRWARKHLVITRNPRSAQRYSDPG